MALFEDHLTVKPEWTDRHGRIKPAYCVLAFDSLSSLWREVGVDKAYFRETNCSTFVLEAHFTMGKPALAGAPLRLVTHIVDHDQKRIHAFHELVHGVEGTLVATYEIMILHVDMAERRSAPMPAHLIARLDELAARQPALPAHGLIGRCVGAGVTLAA